MTTEDDRRRMNLPDRRKNTYDALEARLDAHIDKIERRFTKRFRGMLVAFAIIGTTSTVALFLYGVVLDRVRETRMDFTRSTCEATNERHDKTSKMLTVAAAKDIEDAKKKSLTSQGPVTPEEIRRRRDVTLGLIDALVPKQDCEYQVKLSVGDVEPTPVPTLPAPPKPKPKETP